MGAVDPSYPLYPIASLLSAALLLAVFLTSLIRQHWNIGVAFLCFWLFLENLTAGVNAIIWADNADLKYYIYCDIYSHLELIAHVVKPMSTLIIARRLYLIASLRSVNMPDRAARRWDIIAEWTLGLVIPIIVAGPFYYVVQVSRFQVLEGSGCTNSEDETILTTLLLGLWNILPPVISIIFYYPRAVRLFYRQGKDVNHFLRSNNSVSRTNYIRIFALANIDMLLTLPIGIANLVLNLLFYMELDLGPLPFYKGWAATHTRDWTPQSISYTVLEDTADLVQTYFSIWSSPVLAFAIFGLFGLTAEALASYRRAIDSVARWLGYRRFGERSPRLPDMGTIRFGAAVQSMNMFDGNSGLGGLEGGPCGRIDHGIRQS